MRVRWRAHHSARAVRKMVGTAPRGAFAHPTDGVLLRRRGAGGQYIVGWAKRRVARMRVRWRAHHSARAVRKMVGTAPRGAFAHPTDCVLLRRRGAGGQYIV